MSAPRFSSIAGCHQAEWSAPSGTAYTLQSFDGDAAPVFTLQPVGRPMPVAVAVRNPERFGALPIRNAAAFRKWAGAFIAAGDE